MTRLSRVGALGSRPIATSPWKVYAAPGPMTILASDGDMTFVGVYAVPGISIGDVYRSDDGGKTWSTIGIGTSTDWRDLIYADGKFALVGYTGSVYFSTTGAAWTASAVTPTATYTANSTAAMNAITGALIGEVCLRTDLNYYYIRVAGPAWQSWLPTSFFPMVDNYAIAYGNSYWMLLSVSNGGKKLAWVSSDGGVSWKYIYYNGQTTGATTPPSGLAYGGGTFAWVYGTTSASAGTTARSTDDGVTWTVSTNAYTMGDVLTFAHGLFVTTPGAGYSGNDGFSISSDNAVTWSAGPVSVLSSPTDDNPYRVAYGDSVWAISGPLRKAYLSYDDLATVRTENLPINMYGRGIAHGNKRFVMSSLDSNFVAIRLLP